jgi:hypothetical protein
MFLEFIDALQFLSHATQGAVETRLGGPQWDAERDRHVGQLEIVTEAKRQ